MIGNGLAAEPGDAQSLYPSQPNYAPSGPHPDDQLTPGGVRARAVDVEGTTYERANAAIAHAHKEFARHLEATEKDSHRYSRAGYDEQVALFGTTDAAKAFERAIEQVEARCEKARAEHNAYLASLVTPGDTAAESRNTRFWHRSERLLDSADSKVSAAQDLIRAATREQLGVLLEELPVYLKSVGVSTDWIDPYMGEYVPEYAASKKRLAKAEQGKQLLDGAARYLRKCVADGRRGDPKLLALHDINTAGRLPIDRKGTLQPTNNGKFDPDK
ncbi:hypothetical protein BKG82_00015 [Mycobacteroides chelonae]|uniref:Uncharacterized protein n=1 Tax=Mycobacteroides chelonae TaxID=1774 RepID=A0A1S1LVH7_MYCCH|nr:hypothetical protein [Mycobacteroides chelonae]OHU60938.1 hypothetical protein BKG82_00015 [Mycobacteroides chelonae]